MFLDPDSREALLRWWACATGIPLLSTIRADHTTLAYAPSAEILRAFQPFLGTEVGVRVVGWAADHLGQAVAIESDPSSLSTIPHITIATATDISPAYSNLLLWGTTIRGVVGPELVGRVGLRT